MDRLKKDVWVLDGGTDAEASAHYQAACGHIFDVTPLVPPEAFRNRLEGYQFEGLVFGRCEGVAQRFDRRRAHIVADSSDTIHIALVLSETLWSGDYDGHPADGGMGAIRMMDMARPFEMTTADFTTLNLMLPRVALGEAGSLDLHGLVVSENDAAGALLGQHLRTLWTTIDRLTHTEANAAATATIALIGGVVTAYARLPTSDERPIEKRLRAEARTFIDAHLGDAELSPEAIRAALGISRSLLYQVFEAVGGVAASIQARRLDHAFDTLIGPRGAGLTLAEVAYACGFRSDAHFSRAFRARFALPPGRLRSLGSDAHALGISAVDNPDDVWTWLKRL